MNKKFIPVCEPYLSGNEKKYFAMSESSMIVKINSKIGIGVSYKLDYKNLLPSDVIKHTEKIFLTSLEFNF